MLVSVGIPTFERATALERAARSVLSQTHRELELVISDNASSDATAELCARLCAQDERVRYLRAPVNRGPTANFNELYREVRGEFAMMLSDDDWLEPDYVERCLSALLADRRRVLVCGRARYVRDGETVRRGAQLTLEQGDPSARVLGYLRAVDENGLFYGLALRERLLAATPMRNVLGNDWLVVLGMLAQGTAVTLEETAVVRQLDGTSADFRRLARTLGVPERQALVPHLVIAREVFADVAGRAPAFRRLPRSTRALLAPRAALAAIDWRSLAWHVTLPAAAAARRHRWTRPLWRAYLRVTRALGASHERRSD